jgi:hypothetical protein
MRRSALEDNRAEAPADGTGQNGGNGGGIANEPGSELTVDDGLFVDNAAGAGAHGPAGPPGCFGPFLRGSHGGNGGHGGHGGAIWSASGTTARVTNSTFVTNTAGAGGEGGRGGICLIGTYTRGGVSGNGGSGGGVSGPADLTNVTMSANTPAAGGPENTLLVITAGTAGVGGSLAGPVAVRNSILSSTSVSNCVGPPVDGGFNVTFGGSGCPTGGTNMEADPELGPLHENGGPTETMALGLASPAIDLVPPEDARCPGADQRGIPRPQGSSCDAGALEAAAPPRPALTDTDTGETGGSVEASPAADPGSSPGDARGPTQRMTLGRAVVPALAAGRHVTISISSDEACSIAVELFLGIFPSPTAKRAARRSPVKIGEGRKNLAAAGTTRVRAKLTRRGRRALRRYLKRRGRQKVTVRSTATDGVGNVSTIAGTVTPR